MTADGAAPAPDPGDPIHPSPFILPPFPPLSICGRKPTGYPKRGPHEDPPQMQSIKVERQIGGRTLSIETGSYAKLAAGSVTVQYGETVVFGAVVRANPREGIDFFPLQVDYRERRAAAGKFPGGFMK